MAEGSEFDLLVGAQQLPAEAEWKGSRPDGLMLISLSMPPIGLMASVALGVGDPAFLAVGAVLAAIPVLLGLRKLLSRKKYLFSPERVECSSRGLCSSYHWREPLPAYSGIQAELKGGAPGLHRLVLKHRDDSYRDVTLYQSRHDRVLRTLQKKYARLFGLPALVKTE